MNNVYFVINGKKLYLDFMLEELNDMPFFYVCKDDANAKYLVLCTDFDNEEYILVRVTLHDLRDMLYGAMDIRNAFLGKACWDVKCIGNTYKDDIVAVCENVPIDYLPEEGAKYELLDIEHIKYAERIQYEYETMLQNISMVSYQGHVFDERIESESNLLTKTVDEEFFFKYSDKKEYRLTETIVAMAA